MESLLGVSLPIFVGITLILMGGGAIMVGQAIAATWRPFWQVVFYCILLGFSARFLSLSLFYGDPFFRIPDWAYGTVIDSVVLVIYGLLAYRITRVGRMVAQYPWLYDRQGLFIYREKEIPPAT
jgi:hypothetical protein